MWYCRAHSFSGQTCESFEPFRSLPACGPGCRQRAGILEGDILVVLDSLPSDKRQKALQAVDEVEQEVGLAFTEGTLAIH